MSGHTVPQILVAGSYGRSTRFSVAEAPRPGQTVIATGVAFDHGGKGSNQAVGAARLGADVTFLTALGTDAAAAEARQLWLAEGVRGLPRVVHDAATMIGSICVDANGENSITVAWGAMGELGADDAAPVAEIVDEGWVVVVQNEAPIAFTREVLRLASAQGARTILNPAPSLSGLELHDELWGWVDYITPNEEEAVALLGTKAGSVDGPREVATELAARTGSVVITTIGAAGAILSDGATTEQIAVAAVRAVDTTGAGDTFTAAFAVGISEGLSIRAAVAMAGAAAGHSVQHHGVVEGLPRRAAVVALMEEGRR